MSSFLWSMAVVACLISGNAHTEVVVPADGLVAANTPAEPTRAVAKPYRTFITIQRYTVENTGERSNPIANVKLELTFQNDAKFQLPEDGQYWPIGNGQTQEINRTYEIPWAMIANDGFNFTIQMMRKGSKMLPCNFEVTQLSQFNRAYTCHTDVNWQVTQKTPEEEIDREGIQVRVFTDMNSTKKEIPQDAIALK